MLPEIKFKVSKHAKIFSLHLNSAKATVMRALIIFIFIFNVSCVVIIPSAPCFDCSYDFSVNETFSLQLNSCERVEYNIKTKFINLKLQVWANVHDVRLIMVRKIKKNINLVFK